MANTSIPINTNPTSDPQYTGGEVVLPSDDSVIDINPINENAEALANAVNQLFWDVSQGGGGGTNAQVEINRQNIGAPAGTVLGTNLQTQVNNLGNRVSTAEGDINTLSSNVNTLSGTVSGLSSSVTSLGNRLTTAEGNITADETQIGNIKSAVGIDNTGALTPTVAGTLAKQVADNTGSITNLNTQVGANVIGSTSDTSSQTTVYGYVNGVKDIADANLATLQTLGGGTVPTDSLNNLMDQKLATYTPQVEKNSVFEAAIQDNAVTTDKIRDGAVTHNKLGNAYELLTAQPADWATSYVDYYTIYQLTTAEPADWGVNYDKYYTKSGSGTQANPYVYTPVTSLTTWTSNTYYSFTPTQVSGGSAPSWEFGTYYSAQPAVMSENIGDGEVKTNHIENGAITYDKLSQTLQNQSSKVSNINVSRFPPCSTASTRKQWRSTFTTTSTISRCLRCCQRFRALKVR